MFSKKDQEKLNDLKRMSQLYDIPFEAETDYKMIEIGQNKTQKHDTV